MPKLPGVNHRDAVRVFQKLGYGAKLPVLIIAHPGIGGGIFDHGVTGEFVLTQDLSEKRWFQSRPFQQVYREWKSRLAARTQSAEAR